MLSILIPIYNDNVVDLVSNIQYQCEEQKITYEIICFDDCSRNEIQAQNNKGLLDLKITYQVMSHNLGRSRIRNKLIDEAQYQYLLFIDSDHSVLSNAYIARFLQHMGDTIWTLLYGGTEYEKDEPSSNKALHWHYGNNREAIHSETRSIHAANHIHTNNLLIRKSYIDKIRFDESISGYGYEDLVFGQTIKRAGKKIEHIDNPLLHIGLKTNEHFFSDLKQASINLSILYTQGKINNLKLIQITERLKAYFLLTSVVTILTLFAPIMKRILNYFPKQLYLVDALRLLYFAKGVQIHHKS